MNFLKCLFGFHRPGEVLALKGLMGVHHVSRCQHCCEPLYKFHKDRWRVNRLKSERERGY